MWNKKMINFVILLILNTSVVICVIDSQPNNNQDSIYINVIETRSIDLSFVLIDGAEPIDIDNQLKHIRAILPVSDTGIDAHYYTTHETTSDEKDDLVELYRSIEVSSLLSNDIERTIGIVPRYWFEELDDPDYEDTHGISPSFPGGGAHISSVLMERELGPWIAVHELGHSIGGLCDERSESVWLGQDSDFIADELCPNGFDHDSMDREFDSGCAPYGCPVTTLGIVSKPLPDYSRVTGEVDYDNLMGNFQLAGRDPTWVSTDSYEQLFSKMIPKPKYSSDTLVTSGIIDNDENAIQLFSSYELDSRQIPFSNSSISYNYSLKAYDENNSEIVNLYFNPTFEFATSSGDNIVLNKTYFVIVLNNTINISKIQLLYNGTVKATQDRTQNVPSVSIQNPQGGENISNQILNISWNSVDLDGDNISSAVLFSSNSGADYITLASDLNQSHLIINGADFAYSENAIIKIIVTDGINTNYDTSSSFIIGVKKNVTILNSNGTSIARFDSDGSAYFKGNIYENSVSITTSDDEWVISNSSEEILILNMDSGNLYLDGIVYENQTSINTTAGFTILDDREDVAVFLDTSGNLYLTGEVTENADP